MEAPVLVNFSVLVNFWVITNRYCRLLSGIHIQRNRSIRTTLVDLMGRGGGM
jgi:hypothetical protein